MDRVALWAAMRAMDSVKGARRTPRSVMMAVMYLAGVTSKAGFSMPTPSGVIWMPLEWVTSRGSRCSMGMSVAGGGGEVDGGPGGGDVEGDAVLAGEDGDGVGADLVGGVAVGGDAVRADDDGLDAALAHEVGGHVVAEDGGGDVVLHELPGGEAGALEEGAGLVGEDVDLVAALDGGADDAEGGAVAAGGEGAGVAVGEDGAFLREEFGAEGSELAAVGDVLVVHLAGEGYDGGFDLGDGGVLRRRGGCRGRGPGRCPRRD